MTEFYIWFNLFLLFLNNYIHSHITSLPRPPTFIKNFFFNSSFFCCLRSLCMLSHRAERWEWIQQRVNLALCRHRLITKSRVIFLHRRSMHDSQHCIALPVHFLLLQHTHSASSTNDMTSTSIKLPYFITCTIMPSWIEIRVNTEINIHKSFLGLFSFLEMRSGYGKMDSLINWQLLWCFLWVITLRLIWDSRESLSAVAWWCEIDFGVAVSCSRGQLEGFLFPFPESSSSASVGLARGLSGYDTSMMTKSPRLSLLTEGESGWFNQNPTNTMIARERSEIKKWVSEMQTIDTFASIFFVLPFALSFALLNLISIAWRDDY